MINKRGFTLLELILVVIIIGVLASLGMTNYTKMVEKSRIAEAKTILGQIRTAEEGYKIENGDYTTSLSDIGLSGLPAGADACTTAYYYWYGVSGGTATATRCLATGKTPQGTSPAYTVALDFAAGTWTITGF